MATKKIEMNVKTSSGYNALHPKTDADIVSYNNSISGLKSTSTQRAIDELQTKKGNCDVMMLTDKSVSGWKSITSEYISQEIFNKLNNEGYIYMADLTVTGVTDEWKADILPNPEVAILAPINVTFKDTVRLYSNSNEATPTSLLNVELRKDAGNKSISFTIERLARRAYDNQFSKQAEGELANLKMTNNDLFKDLKILGNSTQDGIPTPDNPVEIVDSVEPTLFVTTKNLIKYPFTRNVNETVNGITFTDNGDGTITANGTATANANTYFNFDDNKGIIPYGKYRFSGCPSGGQNDTYYMGVSDYSGYNSQRDYGTGANFNHNKSLTIRAFIEIIKGQTVENLTFKPQLELAETQTDFVTGYREILKLNGITLRSAGDVRDVLDIDKGVIVRNVKKHIFDSNESINVNGVGDTFYRLTISYTGIKDNLKYSKIYATSNHFKATNGSTHMDNTVFAGSSGNRLYVNANFGVANVSKDDSHTIIVDKFKQWLNDLNSGGNPLILEYAIETPTTEPIPEDLLVKLRAMESYLGETNAFTDNAYVDAEAIQNANLIKDDIYKKIVAMGGI